MQDHWGHREILCEYTFEHSNNPITTNNNNTPITTEQVAGLLTLSLTINV